jgi:hypothetical protein
MKLKVRKINVQREIQRLRAATGPEYKNVMREFMKKQGRLLVSSGGNVPGLVQVTAPHSKSVRGIKARVQGEMAVKNDVWKVYGRMEAMFPLIRSRDPEKANEFWALIKKGQRAKAEKIAQKITGLMLGPWDGGNEHNKRRGRNGRVKGETPSYFIRGTSAPIKKHIRHKMAKVGTLAAAVVNSAEAKLGPLKSVPSFVRRNAHKGGGRVLLLENRSGVEVIVENLNPRMQSDLQRKFDYVLGYRLAAVERQLPFIARNIEKKLAAQLKD